MVIGLSLSDYKTKIRRLAKELKGPANQAGLISTKNTRFNYLTINFFFLVSTF